MKLKNVLLTLGLATTVAAGAMAFGMHITKATVKETNATVWKQNATIYFVPSDKWLDGAQSFKAIFYDQKDWGLQWKKDVITSAPEKATFYGRAVYKFAVNDDDIYPSHVSFCSFSDGGNNQKYYSGNIALPDNFGNGYADTFVMDAEFDGENAWDAASTSTDDENTYGVGWMDTTNSVVLKDFECRTPSASTTRVFVNNSGTHWASGGQTLLHAWGGSAQVTLWNREATVGTLYYLTWFTDDNGTYYAYADLPTDITGFQLVKYTAGNNVRNINSGSYNSQDLWFGDNGYQNCVIYTSSSGNNVSKGAAQGDGKVAGANLMALVCAAVNTCEEGTYNGWGAYTDLYNNFYSKATDDGKAAEVMTLGGKTGYTVDDHFAFLLTNYHASKGLAMTVFGFASNSSTLVITIVVAATLVTFAAFFMVKRSKEN